MTDVKRLLEEATPPGDWTVEEEWQRTASGGEFFIPAASDHHTRKRWSNVVYSDRAAADSALIVYAVNNLPAYEAIREAAERVDADAGADEYLLESERDLREALRRLREAVPA